MRLSPSANTVEFGGMGLRRGVGTPQLNKVVMRSNARIIFVVVLIIFYTFIVVIAGSIINIALILRVLGVFIDFVKQRVMIEI